MARRKTEPPRREWALVPEAVQRIRGSASVVWAAMYRRGADVAPVAMSQSSLARQTGLSRPTIRRSLDKLAAAGYAARGGDGRHAYWQVFETPRTTPRNEAQE